MLCIVIMIWEDVGVRLDEATRDGMVWYGMISGGFVEIKFWV